MPRRHGGNGGGVAFAECKPGQPPAAPSRRRRALKKRPRPSPDGSAARRTCWWFASIRAGRPGNSPHRLRRRRALVALTKSDLPRHRDFDAARTPPGAIAVSSRTGEGLALLRVRLREAVLAAAARGGDVVLGTALRCRELLDAAAECLGRARRLVEDGGGEELVAAEVRRGPGRNRQGGRRGLHGGRARSHLQPLLHREVKPLRSPLPPGERCKGEGGERRGLAIFQKAELVSSFAVQTTARKCRARRTLFVEDFLRFSFGKPEPLSRQPAVREKVMKQAFCFPTESREATNEN